jgi:hypothetical protein
MSRPIGQSDLTASTTLSRNIAAGFRPPIVHVNVAQQFLPRFGWLRRKLNLRGWFQTGAVECVANSSELHGL